MRSCSHRPWQTAALYVSIAGLVLFFAASGLAFLIPTPRSKTADWVHVISLSALPSDGTPVLVPLRSQSRDLWMAESSTKIGDVFVQYDAETGEVLVFRPYHVFNGLRVGVVFEPDRRVFHSVCRGVDFDLNGKLIHTGAPVLRAVAKDMTPVPIQMDGGDVYLCLKSPLSIN